MSRESALPVREDLAGLEPYVSPQLPTRHRMNTNESPYPPPEGLLDEVVTGLREASLNRYPDRDASELRSGLAEHVGHPAEGLWIANGSNEVFLHLFLAFGGPKRTSLTFEPTYSLHTLIPRIAGTATVSAPRGEDSWEVAAETLDRALDEHAPDIVIFCSPNNPTGAPELREVVEGALARVPLVIVDEAYIEFARPDASFLPLVAEHPNLVVTRTFSKAWSLAGVRLGYLLASPELVAAMARVRLPYNLSTFSQLMGSVSLRYSDAAGAAIGSVIQERERLASSLQELGMVVYPSDANFVLFHTGASDPAGTDALWQALYDRGVLVRNYSTNPVLAGCLRVTAGLPEETDAFLEAIREIVR
jgi:histidinol-phosphate aminotransferase